MGMFKKIMKYVSLIRSIDQRLYRVENAIGRIESRQSMQNPSRDIREHEFQVYSQWAEDGIIQYLIKRVRIENEIFVEFGIENYTESNTRFLLQNNNWSGLVLDCSDEHINYVRNDPKIYWKYNLKAERAFITRDNINSLIKNNGISGNIGLLSIDIGGNDYWVWQAIDCISPSIVICEYNHIFGPKHKVVVPYDSNFNRTRAHYSNLYSGASIAALDHLARQKGYVLVAGNTNGNNAFFVRGELLNDLTPKAPSEVYVQANFRESRNEKGKLTFLSFAERKNLIGDMEVYNLDFDKNFKIKDLR